MSRRVSVDQRIRVWNIFEGTKFVSEFRRVTLCSFCLDELNYLIWLVVCSAKEREHKSSLTAACLDPKGRRLLTAHHDGTCERLRFHSVLLTLTLFVCSESVQLHQRAANERDIR